MSCQAANIFPIPPYPICMPDANRGLLLKFSMHFFGTTSDLWSNRTSGPYLSLTIPFIDDWKLKSACLQTNYCPEGHTGELIAHNLREALESWSLSEEQMACMTADNSANMVKALTLNNWTRLQCFRHRLHLAIRKSAKDPAPLKMTERVLEKEAAIQQVLKVDRKARHLVHTWQDIDVLESVKKALSPLRDFTDALSGEDYVSLT
ncbi:uncharacterized protein LOC122968392 [Thunnus albacares]|uniref:uncharacterized protein LOC122968392 n=1 Tax=Thunnus albacares TaxID=8236 RepID=UPI001CF6C81F|nr:uncharacterized protein LOC122968392 [Thunnus albacares]